MIQQPNAITAVIPGATGGSAYLLTPCGAAAVDELTSTSLARLRLQRLHALHLSLQSRLLLAGFVSCLVSALRLLYPTDSYMHACDSPCRCMGTLQSNPSCMERLWTAKMRLSCLHSLRGMVMALQTLSLSRMVGGYAARLVHGLLRTQFKAR